MLDALVWYLLLTLLGIMALPVAYRMLPHLADRGYIFARSIGLLLWGFIFWLLTSFGLLQNDTGGMLAAILVLVILAGTIGRGTAGWREVFGFLRTRTRLVIVTEILFLLAFIFALMMRAGYPDIANTEKPMEMAFINSILRSPQFPPSDPWLSGYAISYYYFGYVLVSMLIRLSGAASGVGFNLAISAMFALTALGAYGVTYSLLAAWSRYRQSKGSPGLFAQGWALLAPAFVLIVSNLEGFLEILHKNGFLWEQVDGKLQSGFWTWLALPDLNQAPPLPATGLPWEITRPGWWWWRASRVIQDTDLAGGYHEVIDEFPFFTYFLADLHPHVLAMPFVLLATGLGLNLFLGLSQQEKPSLSLPAWVKTPDFWFTAIVLGSLAFLNTWDFPIYLALFGASYTLVRYQKLGFQLGARLKDLLVVMLATGVAGILLYLPFYFGFSSQAGGILPSLSFFSRGIHFWIMFAPFLIPIFAFLFWMWQRQGSKLHFSAGLKFGALILSGLWLGSSLLGFLAANLPALGQALDGGAGSLGQNFIQWGQLFGGLQGTSDGAYLLVASLENRLTDPGTWLTLLAILILVWGLFGSEKKPVPETGLNPEQDPVEFAPVVKPAAAQVTPLPFILLLILVGAGLTLVPEFVYLRDQFGGRMNTIFKFYFQAWILWGVAAAAASVILFVELRPGRKLLFGSVWTLLLVAALIYPLNGIGERLDGIAERSRVGQMDWSLNGINFLVQANQPEMAAIDWLSQAPLGIVAEAVGGQYSGYARVSTFSGVPTVLGWPGHESQWRGGAREIGSREPDIDRLYRSSDWNEALNIIQTYGIRYIFIGDLERTKYRANEVKFKNHLAPVFSQGNVIIYEVPAALLEIKP